MVKTLMIQNQNNLSYFYRPEYANGSAMSANIDQYNEMSPPQQDHTQKTDQSENAEPERPTPEMNYTRGTGTAMSSTQNDGSLQITETLDLNRHRDGGAGGDNINGTHIVGTSILDSNVNVSDLIN